VHERADPVVLRLEHQAFQVCDAAAATSSKLKKQALIAEYIRALEDEDLRRALRYFTGRPFAATDHRNLNLGGAIVSDAVLELLTLDPGEFYQLAVRSGELGEAVAKVWDAQAGHLKSDRAGPLALTDVDAAFSAIAATGVVEEKRRLLQRLLARCGHGREAAYIIKIIFGEPRTGVQEGTVQAAVAQAFDKPLAAVQRTQSLLGDLEEVALLARRDALADAAFKLFHPIQFMLATQQEDAAEAAKTTEGRVLCAEDKLDGVRAQIHKSGDRAAIYTRTMTRADDAFPDIIEAVRQVPGEFLLDGEIVPWCDGCVLPFAHMQRRLGRKVLTPEILRENPLAFIAFDILYLNGRLLMDEPLHARRAALATLSPPLVVSRITEVRGEAEIAAAFEAAKARRNEGVMLKDPQSLYSPGRRGQAWLKLKTHLPTLDCVVTAAEYGHGKRRNVLSDYTFAVWDRDPGEADAKLVNIGKAYSGVTDGEIAQLTELFLKLAREQWGRVYLVEPQVVLEIACDQIQKSARHASGYAMRFPRIKRIRWDKRPEDADRLGRVAEIYASAANTSFNPAAGPDGGAAELVDPAAAVKPRRARRSRRPEPTLFDHLD
jgi:DNA ligase-1